MANLQRLISQQEEMASEIEKAIANIKKAPLDRRILDFYQKKSDELIFLWQAFNKTENTMRNDSTLYFSRFTQNSRSNVQYSN